MKALMIQQVYPKRDYLPLLVECFGRNTKYCEEHDIDYTAIVSEERDPFYNGGWDKVEHVKRALPKYELVIWLDVDAMLFDLSRDLREVPLPPDSIGAVRFMMPVPHLNVGVMFFRSGPRVMKFIDHWLSEYPGPTVWHEQEVFNRIRNDVVVELPLEWNRNNDKNPSANPVIMGFHGFGDAQHRLGLIRKHISKETQKAALGAEVESGKNIIKSFA